MASPFTRRRFLQTAGTGGALLGLGDLSAFLHLNSANAAETKGRPWEVRYGADIEPLVRLIEETPEEKCIEVMAERLRNGLSYRDFMSALFLAGLRNGGDFGYYHCIYMIHSVNQLSLDAPVAERLLGMFGALSIFKYWQQNRSKGSDHFGMQKMPQPIPDPDKALPQFNAAMISGDSDAAEQAIISLGRSQGTSRLFDIIAGHAYCDEGVHPWIFVSNTWRVLDEIGWQRAEPVWRVMARTLAGTSEWTGTWYAPNREKAKSQIESLPPSWAEVRSDSGMTRELMSVMRERDANRAFELAIGQMARGKVRAGAVWDAILLAAAEAYMRGDSFNALHSNTGLNALHYAFRTSGDRDVRLRVLMRAVSWLCEGISAYPSRDKNPLKITEISPSDIPAAPGPAAEEIAAASPVGTPNGVFRKALAFAQQHPDSQAFWQLQRRNVFWKGGGEHSYKFLAAIWENSQLVSPQWRPYVVAASVGQAPRVGRPHSVPDSPLILQAREALRTH
jgi:hypothetical protein